MILTHHNSQLLSHEHFFGGKSPNLPIAVYSINNLDMNLEYLS